MRNVTCMCTAVCSSRVFPMADPSVFPMAHQIQRLFKGATMLRVPDHVPIKAKIYGVIYVLQCPMNVWEGGRGTKSYHQWYTKEHKRHTKHAAREGNSRAMKAVVKRRTTFNKWQAATRGEDRRLARRGWSYSDDELDDNSQDPEENLD